jgi:hypothetical protein
VADKGIGQFVDVRSEARRRGQAAHQQKHRNHCEIEIGEYAGRFAGEQRQRRFDADQHGKSAGADNAHRNANRHMQCHQSEHRNEA